jgi:hypothetical protein
VCALLSVSVSSVVPSSKLCGQAVKGCREDIRPRSWYEIWVGSPPRLAHPREEEGGCLSGYSKLLQEVKMKTLKP